MAIEISIADLRAGKPKREESFDQTMITFGRSKSRHVELDHPDISRKHFMIRFEDDGYVLLDEGSRFGTIVDGISVERFKRYPLDRYHDIAVPGFLISYRWDGQKPQLEKTNVVARNLLDELLQGEGQKIPCKFIRSIDGEYRFDFIEEKTGFIMGTMLTADFVVEGEGINKNHLTFIHDISGIAVIPQDQAPVQVNGSPTTGSAILAHGDILAIGSIYFFYYDHPDQHIDQRAGREILIKKQSASSPAINTGDDAQPAEQIHSPHRNILKIFDRLFFLAALAVFVGAAAVLLKLT